MNRSWASITCPAAIAIAIAVAPVLTSDYPAIARDRQPAADLLIYDRAEQQARARVDRARRMSGEMSLDATAAADEVVRALLMNGRGWSSETRRLSEETVRIKEGLLGPNHADLVPSLINLGDVLTAAAEYDRAIAVLHRAVGVLERAGDSPTMALAEALDHLGASLAVARQNDAAFRALERSLRMKEGAAAAATVGLGRTLEAIAFVAQNAGDYQRSGVLIRRAQEIQRAVDPDHPAYVGTLNLVAQQLWFEGRLAESKDASERALALAERTLRPEHPTLARTIRYLAGTLADLGDLSRSHALRERALRIGEREFGPDHYETAALLNSVGMADLDLGEYGLARQRFERVTEIMVSQLGPGHDWVATAHLNLAMAEARLGDFAAARREHGRAIAVWEKASGKDHPFVAGALTELADVYREQGRPAEALPLLQRALAIREKSLTQDHRDVARTLADLASTLTRMGQPTRAQRLADRALAIWNGLDAPDAPDHASALALYAEIYANRGDYALARDYYERALQIRAKVFGPASPLYAETQSQLGLAVAALGDAKEALRLAAAAESTGREHLQVMLRSLPERQALNYAAARPRGLNLLLSLSRSSAEAVPPALDTLIRSRGLVLGAIAARQSAGRASIAPTDPLWIAFTSAQQRLANLMVRGPRQMSSTQYFDLIEVARRDSESAERALTDRSAEFRAERDRALSGLEDVKAALPPDAALVSFVRYDRAVLEPRQPMSPGAGSRHRPIPIVPSYMAFVLPPAGVPVALPLGAVNRIDTLVTDWRQAIVAIGDAADGERLDTSRVAGVSLRAVVWDPVARHLGTARRVFIVPDGTLSLMPFAALPVGRQSYLLEAGPVIHYLSAERDLLPSSDAPSREGGLFAVGGPAFDDRTGSRAKANPGAAAAPSKSRRAEAVQPCALQNLTFPPLQGTLQEVRELSTVWNRNKASTGETASILTGRAAAETTFKTEAHRYRVLHLATHGFFLDHACTPGRSGTRAVGRLSVARPSTGQPPENPLLLSGLAFAGANRRLSAPLDQDDGILTAEEVASLDLQGVEWAVLSACDTGVGQIRAGEGVFGLRRAFQIAGARTVIMSLWSVDDEATRLWMRALYENRLSKRMSTADAVRTASLTMLRQRRARGQSTDPFYWAAFVAAGDWR